MAKQFPDWNSVSRLEFPIAATVLFAAQSEALFGTPEPVLATATVVGPAVEADCGVRYIPITTEDYEGETMTFYIWEGTVVEVRPYTL